MLAGQRTPLGLGYATVLPDFDFEAYSEAGYYFDPVTGRFSGVTPTNPGLSAVGAAVYSEHPSTVVRSLAYDLKDGKGPRLWVPEMPPPQELFDHFARHGLIEAWNSGFEYLIWKNVCVARMGWPPLDPLLLRCAMAKGKAFGLPGKLEKAAEVLGATEQKEKRGKQLIRLLCVPQKPTKKQPLYKREDPDLLGELYSYNIQDIKAEGSVSQMTPDLSDYELKVWQLDQAINQRGVHIDKEALDNCIAILNQAVERYTTELQSITDGEVQSAGEIAKITRFLASQGVHVASLDSDAVDAAIGRLRKSGKSPVALRVLEIRSLLGAASVKKLAAIDRMLPSDQRLKDLFAYCGADRTGRFAGRGPQPQNLPNSGPKVQMCKECEKVYWVGLIDCPGCQTSCSGSEPTDWGLSAVETALSDVSSRNLDWVESQWGDALAAISGCLRGLFCAAPGHDLLCSDFSAIEAVVAAFMAEEEWRMGVFRTHGKIYEAGASKITGIPLQEILDYPANNNGAHHPSRKKIGKVSELASIYGGGLASWKVFGAGDFMTDDEIQSAIKVWRAASPAISGYGNWGVSMGLPATPPRYGKADPPLGYWYGLQGAAYRAIRNPGECFSFKRVTFGMRSGTLYCRLPSGRSLVYHEAKLEQGFTPWGSETTRMTYMGWNTNYLNGPTGWMKMETYGPKICENTIQGIARDILVNSMLNLEAAGYPIVLHIHDEIASEIPKGFGSIEEFERIMATMPDWCADWPIRAAGGWRGLRYRKG